MDVNGKTFKYKRSPNRIYSIMDPKDGEVVQFWGNPGSPSAMANGYGMFRTGDGDIRLLNFKELEEVSEV